MIKVLIATLLLASCSRMGTISLTDHRFGRNPKKIVWFQVAGLTEEHIALLRFSLGDAYAKTSFEENTCLGKMWNYNLLDLRPSAYAGFTSEITGRKIIKNSCDDFSLSPVWEQLASFGHQTAILEVGAEKSETLSASLDCSADHFLDRVALFKMGKAQNSSDRLFHYQNQDERYSPAVYYDRSCQEGSCYSTISNNAKVIYDRYLRSKSFSFFIVRDFTYQKALSNNKVADARDILSDLEKSYGQFLEMARSDKEMLVLLTTSNVVSFEFPAEGKEWAEFDRKGNYLLYHRPALLSLSLATGASSEYFCGLYEEADIFGRLLEGPKRHAERFKFFNIF